METFTNEQKLYLYNKIKRDILGITPLGFFDQKSFWPEFIDSISFRSGAIVKEDKTEDHYSAAVNNLLSSAAIYHALERIDKQLKELLGQG